MQHPLLGDVEVVAHRAARRFIARRGSDGRVRLTVPPGCSEAEARRALDKLAPRLLARQQPARRLYAPGMVIEQPGIRIEIAHDAGARGGLRLTGNTACARILIGPELDMDRHDVCAAISRLMMRVARHRAPAVLIKQAREIALAKGLQPRSWSIGSGLRTLGRCTSDGNISLSAALMYAPEHLRRYVICHELAHLTEMNHSPRFHTLCDAYCAGQEHALAAELKTFPWPLLR